MKSLCFIVGAVFMFYAGRSSANYIITGTLKIHAEDENQIVAEVRIGNSTDSRKKLLLVGKPDMAFQAWVHEHVNDHVTLRLETGEPGRQDGQ